MRLGARRRRSDPATSEEPRHDVGERLRKPVDSAVAHAVAWGAPIDILFDDTPAATEDSQRDGLAAGPGDPAPKS